MTVAARLAREGCEHGTVVVADEQTAGIGRHGHSWHSERGTGLYVSMVLRRQAVEAAPVTMLALGLAVREAIAKTTGLAPDLRWPNDVLIGGKKCAGILAQNESGALIAGIGINVGHTAFPEGIEATSLRLEGAGATREELLLALIEAVEDYCSREPSAIRREFEAVSSYARGRRVRVEHDNIEGVTAGLDGSGFLIVRQDDGTETRILTGGVRPCS